MTTFLLPLEMPGIEAALRDAAVGSPEARWVAAIALGREQESRRAEALAALNGLLRDPVDEVRAQALEGIAEQAHAGASIPKETVEQALRDDASAVRCAAIDAAVSILDQPTHALGALLDDADPSVRATAAAAFGVLCAVESGDRIAGLLGDADGYVVERAALSLADMGDARGEAVLSSMLIRGDAELACEAACGLGKIAEEASQSALRKIAKRRFSPVSLKAMAAAALARCGGSEGRLILGDLLGARRESKRMVALITLSRLPVSGMTARVAQIIDRGSHAEASAAIQTLAALGDVEPAAARQELEQRLTRVPAELKEEIEEALVESVGRA